MRILGISGSARQDSHNTALLRAAAHALPPGTELELWNDLGSLPIFDEDLETGPVPEGVARLRALAAAADGFLIATPEYNGSLPGGLKNALDWLSRPIATNPMRGKPVAVVGASTGLFGAVWAQEQARKVASVLGARVLERELPVGQAAGAFAGPEQLADPDLHAELCSIVDELCAACAAQPVAA